LEENSSALAQAAYENPGSNQRDPPLIGKNWGRSDDTIGIAGIVNRIAPNHQAYFAAGGFGILVGDGALPNYGLEQIVETYYSYAITDSTKVTFDYQFIANPAYNVSRGPVISPAACTRRSNDVGSAGWKYRCLLCNRA
jgi:Carbohydrate-selective porin, OprB family